ncbi:MAG: glycerate kinase [Desulfurococcales archaeon]|nr:glycerate kinase [Desulfurococcales archaeon]
MSSQLLSTVNYLARLVDSIVSLSRLDLRVESSLRETEIGEAVVVAFGKGSCQMADGALRSIGSVEGGVIVVPRGQVCRVEGLEVLESTHPIPSTASLKAAEAVLEWAETARSRGVTLLSLVSGGGSALVEKPLEGLTLEDIIEANRVLLASGLSILEINTIRKHLSSVKGGRLAARAYPANVIGLYASDVPGDRLDLIASGPTVPDPTTFQDALTIIEANGLDNMMPERVMKVLREGAKGLIPETPKPGDPVFERVDNRLVAANIDVLEGLKRKLEADGFNTLILTSRLEGESIEVGKALASIALEILERGTPIRPPAALIAGGETSVTLPPGSGGRGGRNTELALSLALRVDYWRPDLQPGRIGILSMDTDGIDGSSPAAGAITFNGISRLAPGGRRGLLEALALHDSYTVLDSLGLTVITGPTGTNLNSVTIVLIA